MSCGLRHFDGGLLPFSDFVFKSTTAAAVIQIIGDAKERNLHGILIVPAILFKNPDCWKYAEGNKVVVINKINSPNMKRAA